MADATTLALGEEEDTTKPSGEEDATTLALGEEEPTYTTQALGEEDDDFGEFSQPFGG